ncbi:MULTISPECIES: antibiotic biosynthesis monooxygenase [Streptomyces]|uniref:Antibiotic biosynthesis monooxygenase n=1 Tax=Streptomyces glycanivorans TaxID=3033808 RepID=A0ABY9JKJ5_9ACTN|nr:MULTISPECIES: antibiotic biosynthesis monooxygenase [unclassified Streptomyces]WSQ80633.1 antibiotic biosynthesis monooxygenase [Streptomyces sp. NBC_01213]TXS08340.1 antibiotic biosynthesis monooxygenase [Streptomyces sp. wa22]WLQ67211.1 antibiotic biosynthesis monooxygenase [Streptomyces sp. Alt3]WSQ87965.1 antibiotic biosynthesis monooxygenase [Streptomyces sp. NBC_01212]WSR06027.1 antibiotic biosynthesis monooxygenase [Streptomyces sp. NBC_01208]
MPSVQFTSRPDLTRPDTGVVKVSTWDTGTPERQARTVEAVRAAWGSREWPHPGLLSYTVHTGEDGRTLLHHSQWTGEDAYQDFARGGRDERNAEIDAAVPGVERLGIATFEPYRSGFAEGDVREPGCVVTVDIRFVGPDPQRQREWVDSVFEAIDSDPALAPGGISAHFHLGTDGTRVLNYAEWETARAHADALAAPGGSVGSPTPQWDRVRNHPGLASSTVRRWTPVLSIAAELG